MDNFLNCFNTNESFIYIYDNKRCYRTKKSKDKAKTLIKKNMGMK